MTSKRGSQEPQKDSGRRNLQGTFWGKVMVFFAITMSLFHFFVAGTGGMTPLLLRAIHLAFATTLIFFLFPASRRSPRNRITLIDGIGIILAWATAAHLIISFPRLASRAGDPSQTDVLLGIVTIILVLEITRRTTGWLLTIIGAGILLYAYAGPVLPGILAHRGFGVAKIASYMYTSTDGIYGLTLGVSATYIFFFILFGAFLDSMKAGKFFIDFAYSLTGRLKGGPAQTVVVANGLMSTISGVPAADVVTIGTFTFPLLNKLGYDRIFTAALSATASTGAMITPPVMGSAAFLMAEMTGIPYREICIAAAIPAALYYISLFAVTHFYASKRNLVGVGTEELPKLKRLFFEGWFYLVPITVLLYFLILKGLSPMLSGYYSVWSLLIVVLLKILIKERSFVRFREFGADIIRAFKSAAIASLPVVATCAVAGFLVGVLNLTGLGLRFSSIMLTLSHGNLFLALVLTAIASLILGMGLPISACYIILAILVAPALIKMGLTPLAAHLFILFFGAFSAITPPVAIAAYAAAGMQNEDPVKVGLRACWLALTAFAIPFIFVYGQELLMQGRPGEIIWATITATIGVLSLACGIMGWILRSANVLQRTLVMVGGILMVIPGLSTDIPGAILIALVIAWQKVQLGKTAPDSRTANLSR